MTPDDNPGIIQPSCQIRLTLWARKQLNIVAAKVQRTVAENPHLFPGYAGRKLTLSDVICILAERLSHVE